MNIWELIGQYGVQCSEIKELAPSTEFMQELDAITKDAARYHWLRDLKCNSVTVGHDDENACNYMTVAQWIDAHFTDDFSDVPADELQRMRDLNSIWSVQIYPDTPIGFVKYHGATLDAAIDAAMK